MATVLRYTDYHEVANGFGAVGLKIDSKDQIESVVEEAKAVAKNGKPVLINVLIGKTDFRKGSMSM